MDGDDWPDLVQTAIAKSGPCDRRRVGADGIKQVDRLLSNSALNVWALSAYWVPYVVA
jgi:hypothetical protein